MYNVFWRTAGVGAHCFKCSDSRQCDDDRRLLGQWEQISDKVRILELTALAQVDLLAQGVKQTRPPVNFFLTRIGKYRNDLFSCLCCTLQYKLQHFGVFLFVCFLAWSICFETGSLYVYHPAVLGLIMLALNQQKSPASAPWEVGIKDVCSAHTVFYKLNIC